MTIQTISVGTTPNDGTGDSIRAAMGKINSNFAELGARVDTAVAYGAVGDGTTDDTAAWQDAIDGGAATIDGVGSTYKITSTLTLRSGLGKV